MSPLVPLLALALAGAPNDVAKLDRGIALYNSGDLKGSLALLLEALDAGSNKQRATARLYIGLIQHRTGNAKDASASFKHALDLWPQIRPPKGTPRATADAFDKARDHVVPKEKPKHEARPPPPPPPPRVEGGPETLQPVEGDAVTPPRDWNVEPRETEEDPLSATEPGPELEDKGVPVLAWVACGVGAAAAIAGISLAAVAAVNGRRALNEEEKQRAEDLHNAAGVQNKAALATFGAAGVAFGVAALSVTF